MESFHLITVSSLHLFFLVVGHLVVAISLVEVHWQLGEIVVGHFVVAISLVDVHWQLGEIFA